MTKVLIVDDHPLVARYTKAEVEALRPDAGIVVAGTLAGSRVLMADGPVRLHPLRLDAPRLRWPRRHRAATTACTKCRHRRHQWRDEPGSDARLFFQGAKGYLTKSTVRGVHRRTAQALRQRFFYPRQAADPMPARSTHRLTPREAEVLRALAIGKANKQLAPTLNISESTFKTYLRNIYEKLGVRTRVAAVRRGEELGVVDTRRRR